MLTNGDPGDGGDPLELFDAIASLVDSSMVLADRSSESEARFIVLETLREFGLEQLEIAGEAETYRRRHALAFLQLAEITDKFIWGPEAYRWVQRLDQEHDNFCVRAGMGARTTIRSSRCGLPASSGGTGKRAAI